MMNGKILLTGASGFLGRFISEDFSNLDVLTLGRDLKSDIICDLSTCEVNLPHVDLVIHAAGKAHLVPNLPVEKQLFFQVNVEGTRRLLNSLEIGRAHV